MDYNKLKYFVTVVEKKSLSNAAKVLKSTQSAISQQVRKLEEELNTKLFERIGKQIILTPEGQQIFELAKEKFGDIDEHVDRVISKVQSLKGQIRVGFASEIATPFPLFQLIGRFRKKYPNISFEISFGTNSHIEDGLLSSDYDIGFLTQFESRDHFDTFQTSHSLHFLITSKEYLEAKGPFTTIDSILKGDLIDFDLNFSNLKQWMRKNSENKIPELIHRTPDLIVPNHMAAVAIIDEGHGIALLPEYLIEESILKGKLVKLLPQFKGIPVWLELTLRKSKQLQDHEKVFIDFIKESMAPA